jgi:hypothetical protein
MLGGGRRREADWRSRLFMTRVLVLVQLLARLELDLRVAVSDRRQERVVRYHPTKGMAEHWRCLYPGQCTSRNRAAPSASVIQ